MNEAEIARLLAEARSEIETNKTKAEESGEEEQPTDEIPEEELPKKPIFSFKATSDRLQVEMEMLPGGLNTLPPTYEELIGEVEGFGVKFGIREDALRDLAGKPFASCTITVAQGKAGEIGEDGYLNYVIETDRSMRPKERDDGTIDYRDLGFIQNVMKGQTLVEVYGAKKGADGMDVYGQVIEGRYGKEPYSPLGKNTEMNEEKTALVASCDGSVSVTKGICTVIDQLKINGNVDNSTGDINFVGDV
ncbi:MAG: FapA family protein, partial [Oscillospiraceae bacterium]|nr:FapA family protein [Oscillospiraceae bacterium]